MRGNSAFDIALWDLFGKVTGQPIAQLLGGFTPPSHPHLQHLRRHRLHARTRKGQTTANYGIGAEARTMTISTAS